MRLGLKKKLEKNALYFRLRWLTTKYLLDKPKVLYQPLPWCRIETAKRNNGCRERLQLILREIGERRGSILDIGCAEGFFSISLAEKGFFVTGIDIKKDRVLIARTVAGIAGVNNVSFLHLRITEENAYILPKYDFSLCLSVWHHWIRYFGFDKAVKMLKVIWSKTADSMFFETGFEELPEYFNMPKIEKSSRDWIMTLLGEICPESAIKALGKTPAFPTEQFLKNKIKRESYSTLRNLYYIKRNK